MTVPAEKTSAASAPAEPGVSERPSTHPKPVLASDLLADERAPLEPGRQSCRLWLGTIALGLALLGALLRVGLGPASRIDDATVAFTIAGALAALALLPFPYALRAGVALLAGVGLMTLGLRGVGPLAGLGLDGGQARDILRLSVLTALPAALMLRARYAPYPPSRWIVVGAFVASLPLLVLEAQLALEAGVAPAVRVAAGVGVVAIASSLFSLAGDGSLGSRSPAAWLILLALPLELGVRELSPLAGADMGPFTYPLTAAAVLLAATLTSLGTYQLAASFFGPLAQAGLKKMLAEAASARITA